MNAANPMSGVASTTNPPPEPIATLAQRRASHAYDRISKLMSRAGEQRDQYAIEARKLPVRIIASGLGQALAFVSAKAAKRDILHVLHDDLTDWVVRCRLSAFAVDPQKSLLHNIIHGDSDFLRWATDETLVYLSWLNRFAEAQSLPGKQPDEQ